MSLRTLPALLSAAVLTIGCTKKESAPTPTPDKPTPHASPDAAPPAHVDMPAAADIAPLAKASNAFGVDLYGQLRARPGNLALSPAGISIALAMTWGGAKGDTAAQLRKVLHLDGDPATVGAAWGKLAGALQDPARPLTLRIANRLFGEQSFRFERPFLDATAAAYGAPLEPLDFVHAAEAQRVHINGWVADRTAQRITNLLPPASLDDTTRMVLVNAIYFLADWASPFEPKATFAQPFHRTATDDVSTMMMHQRATYGVAHQGGVSVLAMPYRGGDAEMWIVLPDKIDGLAEVERTLDAATLDGWRAALAPQEVQLTLPRFVIDPADPAELAQPLATLGMPDAFDAAKADLTGIGVPPDPRNRLFISRVFHKAFVKVDEKGTEAAAATAVVAVEGAGMPAPAPQLAVDHPFLYLIVDKASGLVLFMGRVADPSA